MRPTRRNLLIGLATATVGGGAAFGSGAFSQVEADRTVNVTVANDDSALLQLDANDGTSLVTNDDGSSNKLQFDLQNLNDSAVTTVSPAFTITNTGGQNVAVRVRAMDTDASPEAEVNAFSFSSNANGDDVTTYPGSGSSGDDNNLVSGSGSVSVDMQIDSTGSNTPTDANVVRIEADESQYQS